MFLRKRGIALKERKRIMVDVTDSNQYHCLSLNEKPRSPFPTQIIISFKMKTERVGKRPQNVKWLKVRMRKPPFEKTYLLH